MLDNFNREMLEFLYEGVYLVDTNRVITAWNKGAENITGFSAKDVVGKNCAMNFLNHVDTNGKKLCMDGCPLHATMADGKSREAKVFLHHKDGFRVPVYVRTMPMYDENNEIQGALEIFINSNHNLRMLSSLEKYRKEAMEDQLTGVSNRRYIELSLISKFTEYVKLDIPMSVAFIDIDHFKKVNDVYGHNIGDNVLKMITKTLENNIRSSDIVGRWGGEEFIIIFQGLDNETLYALCEKFRFLVENSYLTLDKERLSVTISIGATSAKKDDTIESLIQRSDKLMYESKKNGRNRITID